MPAAKSLRQATHGHPVPQFTGVVRRGLAGNMGTSDIRGNTVVQTITMNAWAATDSFKIRVYNGSDRTDYATTAAIVQGTNSLKADIQTLLRALTFADGSYWDQGVTVGGSDDTGPFTLTPGENYAQPVALVDLVACNGSVTTAGVSYIEGTGHAATATQTPATHGDSPGFDAPLGTSVVTDGGGQTEGTALAKVTIDGAAGGNDSVVVTGTEVASGGTGAVVLYSVFKTDSQSLETSVATEDADGDVTISSLTDATNYYLIGYTQTVVSPTASRTHNRVSEPSDPVYFTTT